MNMGSFGDRRKGPAEISTLKGLCIEFTGRGFRPSKTRVGLKQFKFIEKAFFETLFTTIHLTSGLPVKQVFNIQLKLTFCGQNLFELLQVLSKCLPGFLVVPACVKTCMKLVRRVECYEMFLQQRRSSNYSIIRVCHNFTQKVSTTRGFGKCSIVGFALQLRF